MRQQERPHPLGGKASGNVWRHFGCLRWGRGEAGSLKGKSQGCSQLPTTHRAAPANQDLTPTIPSADAAESIPSPFLEHWPSKSHVRTHSAGDAAAALSLQGRPCPSSSPPAGHTVGIKDRFNKPRHSGHRKRRDEHPSIVQLRAVSCSKHTHILQKQTSHAPRTALLRDGAQKKYVFSASRAPLQIKGFAHL